MSAAVDENIVIEFCHGQGLQTRQFDDHEAAMAFYQIKQRTDKNPTVVSGQLDVSEIQDDDQPDPPAESTNDDLVEAAIKPQEAEPQTTRVSKGRPYWAGRVVALHFEEIKTSGFSEELVKEVSKLTNADKPNDVESLAWLRISWNIINGARQAFDAQESK